MAEKDIEVLMELIEHSIRVYGRIPEHALERIVTVRATDLGYTNVDIPVVVEEVKKRLRVVGTAGEKLYTL